MKWVYIPIMFALAFLYTKMSFNNYEYASISKDPLLLRKPASTPEVIAEVPSLEQVSVSTFFQNLNNEELSSFDKVANYKGPIVGDVHIENFSFVIDDQKKAHFSVNNFNEVTEGVLFHDVLNHLIAAKTLEKKVTWLDYFESYKKGLKNEAHVYSFYVEKGLENALSDSEEVIDENITTDAPFEFTKIKKTHHHISANEKNMVQYELKKIFPKNQIFDIFESNKAAKNYQVLIRLRPQDKIQWLDIKENTISRYDRVFNKLQVVDFDKRFEMVKTNIYSGKLDKSIRPLLIDHKYYTLKVMDQFASKLKLDQVPSDDYRDIIMDEAYILGKIHSNALVDNTDEYIKSWATIPASVVDEKAVGIKYKLKDLAVGE